MFLGASPADGDDAARADAELSLRYAVHAGRGFFPARPAALALLRLVDKLDLPPNAAPHSAAPRGRPKPQGHRSTPFFGSPPKVALGVSSAADLDLCMSSLAFSCLHVLRSSPLRKSAPRELARRRRRYFFGLGVGWLVLWWLGFRWFQLASMESDRISTFGWIGADLRRFLGAPADWRRAALAAAPLALGPTYAVHGMCRHYAAQAFHFLWYAPVEVEGELFFVRSWC